MRPEQQTTFPKNPHMQNMDLVLFYQNHILELLNMQNKATILTRHFSTPFTYKVHLKWSYCYLDTKESIFAWNLCKLMQTTISNISTWMKVAYYETRRKSKQFTYKVCLNPMHGYLDMSNAKQWQF